MSLHLHIGPGNHERILLNQLSELEVDYSSSNHYPKYLFKTTHNETGSVFYDRYKQLTWGIGNRLGIRKNKLIDFTYPLYDKITANKIDKGRLLFGWAQVSLHSFRKNQGTGINVLDYPIPHPKTWQEMLLEERELTGITPHSLFSNKMIHRMLEEIELADYISLPSTYVKESFIKNGVPENKIIFNPYGISTQIFNQSHSKKSKKKLEVVFVGSIEIRKGIHYLLEAFTQLDPKKFKLNLVGGIQKDLKNIKINFDRMSHIDFLGSLTKEELVKVLSNSHVMVMPSILEGLSLTILEALSSQIPVISTRNAGGLGVIKNFEDGFVIDIRNPDQIAEKLEWFYNNMDKIEIMGANARKKVVKTYSDHLYAKRFIEKVYSLSNENSFYH